MSGTGEIILYNTEDGEVQIQLRAVGGTVWLTQAEMARLFSTSIQNISLHLRNIFSSEELDQPSVVKESLITASDGKAYSTALYELKAILAVGYRVRSARGTQFRRWATTILQDYLIKGFVIDDERLKDPRSDYFDELLERIRDIRASEARFYLKLRDILALSEDYVPSSLTAQAFYATIQNKMLYATTGHTAAELITTRADPAAPHMGLMTFKGKQVRKGDVATAKNYLAEKEISDLNLIVTIFLDTADLRTRRRQTMRLLDWDSVLDSFLRSNDLPILRNAGSVSKKFAEQVAHERYETFVQQQREAERQAGDADFDVEVVEELARIEATVKAKKPTR